jgi:hypothetical protein
MAKTALTQLQDQIEAVRREAFATGYAAAMQSIRDFAAKPPPGAAPVVVRPQRRRRSAAAAGPGRPAPRRQPRGAPRSPRGASRAPGRRPQRGSNAQLIEEVLQSNAPRALRPAEIRRTLQRDKGVAMAFTSIRHALGQLEQRGTAEQIVDSKTWRHRGSAGAESA